MRATLVGLLVLVVAVTSGCTTDQPASAVAPTEPVEEPTHVEQALDVASAYFAAFNDGDADAITTLLAGTAEFSDSFTGPITREAWDRRLAWNIGQGTTLASPNCFALANTDADRGAQIACESATSNAPIQAVGARPVPTLLRFSVTPYGITGVREEYGRPDFLQATTPFIGWLEEKHPDAVEVVGFDGWASIDDARQRGAVTRDLARLWAAWLEANCVRIPDLISPNRDSYLDDC